jgi:hypothetical protein
MVFVIVHEQFPFFLHSERAFGRGRIFIPFAPVRAIQLPHTASIMIFLMIQVKVFTTLNNKTKVFYKESKNSRIETIF